MSPLRHRAGATALVIGESRAVQVDSAKRWSRTGLLLESAAEYEMHAQGRWLDAGHEWGPQGHDGRSTVYKWTGLLRRRPDLPWFALVGSIDRELSSAFLIGEQAVVRPPKTGELTCFANDVWLMYFNNHGSVFVRLTRL